MNKAILRDNAFAHRDIEIDGIDYLVMKESEIVVIDETPAAEPEAAPV